MEENLDSMRDNGDLKAENDFLKMKMMLERGAHFDSARDIDPAIENHFLKSVMEYEKQFEKGERITVFDKLGQPRQFRPVKEISDGEIEREWEALYSFMQERGVELSVCSPNVKARELYRFAVEELFNVETDKIDMPGMMTCFIYDEFHPDYAYENSRIAVEECMNYFFDKAFFQDHHFADTIRLNHHEKLSKAELKYVVQKFKKEYDEIVPVHIKIGKCGLSENHCVVKGFFEAAFMIRGKSELKRGDWMVAFQRDKELGYWDINDIQVSGVHIP